MESNCEKISIIIPVYKVEKYLERCIESICNQTYTNLEIILVDDGSPDNCPKMCDAYAQKDSRIMVIHKKNGGLSSARNAALEVATGKYILFVDSDDYVHLSMVEKLYNACKSYNADISIGLHYVEKGDKLSIEDPIVDETEIYSSFEALEILLHDKKIRNYAWNKLYKAGLFEGVRYPEGRNYEDIPTTYLLFHKANRICRIPEYLYYYQMRDDSISSNKSDEKWYANCKDMVWGYRQQYTYLEKREPKLADISLYHLVHYIYTAIDTGYRLGEKQELAEEIEYLIAHKESVYTNAYLEENAKRRMRFYERHAAVTNIYIKIKPIMKQVSRLKHRGQTWLKSQGIGLTDKYDFSLAEGKDTRLVFFELPCFDNLGDHAIAYAGKDALEKYVQEHKNCQLYVVKSWDTVEGIAELKRQVGKNDIIFCQGGGNMGDLYPFAEAFRNKVLNAFSNQRIVVFPQSIYYSSGENGKKALEQSKEAINGCKKLTLCARDHVSYEYMKSVYDVNIVEMRDIVSYLDKTDLSEPFANRNGVVLCLRSDKESALSCQDKKRIQKICENATSQLLVSDTVIGEDISDEQREEVLTAKWRVFGASKLIVTDRLHGMIFALITKTPCVVLGNNHHKVRETFKTLADCGYLYYAESVEEVEGFVTKVYALKKINDCRNVENAVEKIEQLIA